MASPNVAAGEMKAPANALGDASRVEALLESTLGIPVRLRFRFTHFVQMSVQFLLFVYWALYSTHTRSYLAQLGYLVLFGFGVDFVVSALRYKSWYASFAPIPVVFSANLFVWFIGSDAPFAYAIVALAIGAQGWLSHKLSLVERAAFIVAGLLLAWSASWSDTAGALLAVAAVVLHRWRTGPGSRRSSG